MANREHLNLLKQGVDAWNRWREEYPKIHPNLRKANLNEEDLHGINFSYVDLSGADLTGTNLSNAILIMANFRDAKFGSQLYFRDISFRGADLSHAILPEVRLRGADFGGANLFGAQVLANDFRRANLSRANLHAIDLFGSDLSDADLSDADLSGTNLTYVNLYGANLSGTNLTKTRMNQTIFGNVDLRTVKGLETIHHTGPSTVGIDTILRSEGNIPEIFLRGTGASDTFIEYIRSLVQYPLNYYTSFICHSSKDQDFAERLYADLQRKGVRCWFASEDLKIGDHYHQRIDESIHLYDKLILILSEYAVQSAWVEREVVSAREKEDREQRPVLFPIRLDDAVMDTTKAWAADVRRRWHIGDFTQWKDPDAYQQTFERLLRYLKKADEQQDQEMKQ